VAREDYKRSLELAKAELGELHAEKTKLTERISDIDSHINEITEGIKGLARLCDQQVTREMLSGNGLPLASGKVGLNDAVRFALQTSKRELTPLEVRERLRSLGFDMSKYKSEFMATLHTVLKRLDTIHREVDKVPTSDGKTAYKWITETDKAAELILSVSGDE
jgi:hypothetical protein